MPLLLRRRSVLDLLNENADFPRPVTGDGRLKVKNGSASPTRPVSEGGPQASRLSRKLLADELSDDDIGPKKGKRFSLMKMRNFSESHLAARAKVDALREEEEPMPPVPRLPDGQRVPAIVKTAPTMSEEHDNEERKVRPSLFRRSMSKGRPGDSQAPRKSTERIRDDKGKASTLKWRRLQGRSTGLEDLARLSAVHATQNQHSAPPSYGDESSSALALPVPAPRFSESSQSDGSNASSNDQIYGQMTTTTHTVSTHTTFFKLPRRNKNRNSLFPLPLKLPPPDQQNRQSNDSATPRASTSAISTRSMHTPDSTPGRSPPKTILQRRHTEVSPTKQRGAHPPLPRTTAALPRASLSFAEPGGANLSRNDSELSRGSSYTSSPLQPPMRFGMRDRASTTSSSLGRESQDIDTPPPLQGSARTSTSTTGRSSLGGLLSLSRFRQGSEPHSPRHGSPGTRSKSSSFALSREALVVPERQEGDTPGKYLERLEAAVARSMIAGILSKSADPFAQSVLRSYTRRFPFFGEPIDMSLRKFLLEAELPKETQQVDRVIQAFADRYHECNPGIFVAPDQAYIIAFSLMMLHTDAFNKNNKRKMQKHDYIKNTSGQQVADEVLGCFYDNICYTPFVHYEEEVDINGERIAPFKPKKSKLKGAITDSTGKKPSGPVDPYNLLVDQKLDLLRPNVKDSITFEDPYNYRGTHVEVDAHYLQRAFTHTGILQIISARSRPTAYEGGSNHNSNPAETQAGIIDLKITKVGTLWRKATKKKKARSPWQEWGAILTGSQLYLFKNAHWAKTLLQQFLSAQKHGQPRTPVIFKPPLTEFKPDALIKTDNAVALVDATYNRHKHAFTFFRVGGHEEVLLADNESERNDWLALINYAAAFRAAGVRIRGMVGGNEEDLRRRDVTRMESAASQRSIQSATGEVVVKRGGLSPALQDQVMAARRQIMVQKIAETEKEFIEAHKQLDAMLRNARHLLILAPIPPRTREDIVHAAAKVDANIKWVRRDLWRMRCHKDILALDVHQDGVTANELQTLTSQHSETVKKEKPAIVQRSESRAGARSPPQTPTSPTRPSTKASIETFIGGDVFRTPSESAAETTNPINRWHLPPLQLDVSPEAHRGSVSTHLSVSSPGLSHASSLSSVRPPVLPKTSEAKTPRQSTDDSEVEMLARRTMTSESAVMALDGAVPLASSPETKHKSGGVRRSLQKTLREAHGTSSAHRHKRSDGTVRSEAEEAQEGTPHLQREKGRFILHGKQASVVQFGANWADERMKLRRDRWREDRRGSAQDESEDGTTADFRKDAELADTFALTPASPERAFRDLEWSRTASENGDDAGKRTTVIGPKTPVAPARGRGPSLSKGADGTVEVESDTDGFSLGSREYRRTVIGPSSSVRPNGESEAVGERSVSRSGTEEEGSRDGEGEGEEDDSMIAAPLDDEELRRICLQATVAA